MRRMTLVDELAWSMAGAAALAVACSGGGLAGAGASPGGAAAAIGGSGSDTGGEPATGGTSNAAGGGGCQPGEESCPCYPNQTCNSGLECLSSYCVDLGSAGGSSTGGSRATGGTASETGGAATTTGGMASETGGAPTATGGTPSETGGTAMATGGSPTGGTATGGNGAGGGDDRFVNGPWAGYVWTTVTGTGSTISPTTFDGHTPGTPFCASGSVGAMTDYSGVGVIGYNLNQAVGSTVLGTWTPTSTAGVRVTFTNSGGSALRLQIQGPNGATNENDRWCYPLTGSSGTITIPWANFNTYCWGGTGTTYYSGQPLQAVMLLVPGGNLSAVSFSICLSSIGPA